MEVDEVMAATSGPRRAAEAWATLAQTTPAVASVDTAAVQKAIAREVSLLAAYDGAPAAPPEAAAFRQHHEAHLAELRQAIR